MADRSRVDDAGVRELSFTDMRLTADEEKALNRGQPVRVWRAMEQVPQSKAQSYRTHTVLFSNEEVHRTDVEARFGQKELAQLDARFGHWRRLWLAVVVPVVDDEWPLLAYSGLGDEHGYTDRQRRTRTGQPVALRGEPRAVPRAIVDQWSKGAEPEIEQKQRKRQAKYTKKQKKRDEERALMIRRSR